MHTLSILLLIPRFILEYVGTAADTFTTIKIGNSSDTYLNLELRNKNNEDNTNLDNLKTRIYFGRIIVHTDDVDELYSYLKNDNNILKLISFENQPKDALWGEGSFISEILMATNYPLQSR